MPSTNARLLKLASLAAGILGAIALFVIVTPLVFAQRAPHGALADWKAQWHRAQSNPLVQWRMGSGTGVGVEVRDVDEADVKREKPSVSAGAVIEDVRSDSPAAKAGMKAGDVIVNFDGERVRGARHFERLVSETPAGRTVDATVLRAGSKVSLKVTIDTVDAFEPLKQYSYRFNRPESFTITMPKWETAENFYGLTPRAYVTGRAHLGVGVVELTPQLGEYFGASQGVLITEVDEGTPGKTAGLKAGDVITQINGAAVRSSADLRRKLSEATGETKLTVIRDKTELTLTVKMQG